MDNWKVLNLVEQLRALQHLPPHARLTAIPYQPDAALLESLIHLPIEVNPLEWLEETHQELIVHVLLWRILNHLQMLRQGVLKSIARDSQLSLDDYRYRYGYFLESLEATEIFQALDESRPLSVSSIALEIIWTNLHNLLAPSKISAEPPPYVSNDKYLLLLHKLIQFQNLSDSTEIIRSKYSNLAAFEALQYILFQILPPLTTLSKDSSGRDYFLDMSDGNGEVSVTLDLLSATKLAFSLTLRTYVDSKWFRGLLNNEPTAWGIEWKSVSRVVDDIGYSYIVYPPLDTTLGSWHSGFDLSMKYLCYPSIARDATKLTLISKETSIVATDMQSEQDTNERMNLGSLLLGDLNWHISLTQDGAG